MITNIYVLPKPLNKALLSVWRQMFTHLARYTVHSDGEGQNVSLKYCC